MSITIVRHDIASINSTHIKCVLNNMIPHIGIVHLFISSYVIGRRTSSITRLECTRRKPQTDAAILPTPHIHPLIYHHTIFTPPYTHLTHYIHNPTTVTPIETPTKPWRLYNCSNKSYNDIRNNKQHILIKHKVYYIVTYTSQIVQVIQVYKGIRYGSIIPPRWGLLTQNNTVSGRH